MTPPHDSPDPVDTPLNEVVDGLAEAGFDGQFRSVEGGRIQCLTCRSTFEAAEQRADAITRLEGASDPADMLMIIPVRCPSCGASGTLVLGYGPDASPEDTDVIRVLRRTPGESGADGGEPPAGGRSVTSD